MFTTKLCQSAEEVKQCLDIRIEVFVQEQHFTMEDEIDEKDGPSDHILLLNEVFIPIGTIRWFPPLNKLGRLAILKEYRGKGLGYKLVKALEDHLVSRVGKGGIGNQGKDNCLSEFVCTWSQVTQ